MNPIHAAYYAAQAADDAWSAELQKQFGRNAGDMRYTPRGRGEPGSKLAELHAEFRRTSDLWHAAIVAARNAARDAGVGA